MRNFLLDTSASLPGASIAYCNMLNTHILTLSKALHVAGNASIVRKNDKPFFLPPFAAINATPFPSMIERVHLDRQDLHHTPTFDIGLRLSLHLSSHMMSHMRSMTIESQTQA
eukprot:SAG31_NODE_28689_length_406_cov_1.107492_1_plen_112_part_01